MNATRTATRPPSKPADRAAPHVRIPVNLDLSRIKPPHLKMLLILEAFWGDKTYCWPSNETLAKKFGCSVSRARQILYEMEDLGYIYLLPADDRKPHGERAGIFAHSRLNPDRPVEDRPPPPEAIERLWAARAQVARSGRPTLSGSCKTPCRNSDTFERVFVIVEPDAFRTTGHFARSTTTKRPSGTGASSGCPRSGNPRGRASTHRSGPDCRDRRPRAARGDPPGRAEPTDQAGDVEVLTAGQRAFLASLGPEQRAGFDALPADRRAEYLAPHGRGYDRVIGADQASKLSPRKPVELPPIPATLEDLIEQLPGSPRSWPQQAAQALALTFGSRKDEQLWGEFHKIAELVAAGRIDPGPVRNAYRQAMAPGIKKPGAKFWAAFQGLTGLDEGDLKAMIAGREPSDVR